MRRGLLAVGLVIVVMAALVSIPTFLGLALGHSLTESGSPGASAGVTPPAPGSSAQPQPFPFQSSDGYGMTLPGGWTSASMEVLQEQLLLSVLRSSNPDVARLVDGVLTATGADISMVGGDIRELSSSPVPPNVSVLTEPVNGESLSAVSQRIAGLLGAMDGVSGPPTNTEALLGGLPATRLDWTMKPATAGTQSLARDATLQTYLTISGGRLVIVTLAGNTADHAANRKLFDAIVASFRFVQPPTHN
jgi:hypothetical protein